MTFFASSARPMSSIPPANGPSALLLEWWNTWTRGDCDDLIRLYAPDALYADPFVPGGLVGVEPIARYLRSLRLADPLWVWESLENMPLLQGSLVRWRSIALVAPGQAIEFFGLCIVQLGNQRVARSEFVFDRLQFVTNEPRPFEPSRELQPRDW
ncbi:MAG: nuclear transport factor 2 family protein [Polyangiaceae bacterium]